MAVSQQELLDSLRSQVVPVTPDDTMADAARKALLLDFIRLLEYEPGSRSGEDIEDVHQMRVAARRIRSIFTLLGEYFKPKTVAEFQRRLRKTASALGAVRDLDVMIDNLRRFQETLSEDDQAALQGAIHLLQEKRTRARQSLISTLDKRDYRQFVRSFAKFATSSKGQDKAAQNGAPLEARYRLPVVAYEHLAAVRAYDAKLEDGEVETLHMLRIEFKRLRYLVSVFEELLGKPGRDFIGELKTIQDHLGRLNDSAVAQERLRDLLPDLDETQAAALEMYIGTLVNEEQNLVQSFPDVWRRFNTRVVQRQLATAVAGL